VLPDGEVVDELFQIGHGAYQGDFYCDNTDDGKCRWVMWGREVWKATGKSQVQALPKATISKQKKIERGV